ncbi:MAG: hypothetical protein ACM3VS_01170 [Candidatus Dadabacteria bacterium]
MKLFQHLCALLIVTVLILLIYTSVQQTYRSNANDPQVQIAGDLKYKLEAGKPIDNYFHSDTIDLERSLLVFIETYDDHGKPLKSSGLLNNQLPVIPAGVLNVAKEKGEDWVTWQPGKQLRFALGVVKVNTPTIAYVAVARSLKEVEKRTGRLVQMIIISWAMCFFIIVLSYVVQGYNDKSENELKGRQAESIE